MNPSEQKLIVDPRSRDAVAQNKGLVLASPTGKHYYSVEGAIKHCSKALVFVNINSFKQYVGLLGAEDEFASDEVPSAGHVQTFGDIHSSTLGPCGQCNRCKLPPCGLCAQCKRPTENGEGALCFQKVSLHVAKEVAEV